MFTNEEVRTAMTGLVKQKGEDHVSFGRYANPMTGQGACFLGALCQFMGQAIPTEGTGAGRVLPVSREMQAAFGVAQNMNDSHFEWKYILRAVDLVLALDPSEFDRKLRLSECPCGCQGASDSKFARIIDDMRVLRMVDRQRANKGATTVPTLAKGGVIQPFGKVTIQIDGGSLASSMGTFSQAMTEFSISAGNLSAMFTPVATTTGSVFQKDHALTA